MLKLLDNMQHGSERITGIVAELEHYVRDRELDERRPLRVGSRFTVLLPGAVDAT
jgi:hypothetical protein